MPARLIRDDMLDSERVQTLPVEARWLYLTALLSADDVGLFEVSPFKLGRRAGIDMQRVPVLITLLADSDLIRLYEADGKRLAFIPRFRQRLQIKRSRYPAPPAALYADDADAASKFKDLAANPRLCNGKSPLDNRLNLNLNPLLRKGSAQARRVSNPSKTTPDLTSVTVPSAEAARTAKYLADEKAHAEAVAAARAARKAKAA